MLFSVFILGISFLVNNGVNGGNQRPYWVSTTGFQGAGTVGQDASANGYAGSSLVSPLSSSGVNSPVARYISAPPNGNPGNAGFGGFASGSGSGSGGGGHSSSYGGK